MANRVLRSGILDSDRINKLTWAGEVFYRRLMSVVDDFGRYDARPQVLRADLYKLKLDKVSESDVEKWMGECSEAGLVRFYDVERKSYLVMLDFNQTIRIKKAKYPDPPEEKKSAPQMQADAPQTSSTCVSGSKPNQSGVETGEGITPAAPINFFRLHGRLYNMGIGDYFRQEHSITLNTYQMQHRHEQISVQVLERMNTEYVGHTFNGENHILSTFKSVWRKVAAEKKDHTEQQGSGRAPRKG